MATSNTRDCFREVIGKRVTGVLFDALPRGDVSLRNGNNTLIFEDRTGLTLRNNGAYWLESPDDINRAVFARVAELQQAKDELEEALRADGLLEAPHAD